MHTVIRHTTTPEGYAVVITGRAAAEVAAVVQVYKQVPNTTTCVLLEEFPCSSEVKALRLFQDRFGNPEISPQDLSTINQFLKDLDQLNLDTYNDLGSKQAADFLDDIITSAAADITAKYPD